MSYERLHESQFQGSVHVITLCAGLISCNCKRSDCTVLVGYRQWLRANGRCADCACYNPNLPVNHEPLCQGRSIVPAVVPRPSAKPAIEAPAAPITTAIESAGQRFEYIETDDAQFEHIETDDAQSDAEKIATRFDLIEVD